MDILLTGADGFVGSFLKGYLSSKGFKVFGTSFFKEPLENEIKIDLSKKKELVKLPDKDFSTIIHTAGIVDQTVPSRKIFVVNADSTRNMLAYAKRHGCRHFIFTSSISVYGLKVMGEKREECATKRCFHTPCFPYGRSKAKAEKYIEKSGIPYTILRLPAIFGAGDSYLSEAIIPPLLNGTFAFFGKKDKLFSTMFVKNLGRIMQKMTEKGPANDCFNCSDGETTWRNFIDEFAKKLKIETPKKKRSIFSAITNFRDKRFMLMATFSYFGAHYPNLKLKNWLDFEPEFDWRQGVKEAVGSFAYKLDGKAVKQG